MIPSVLLLSCESSAHVKENLIEKKSTAGEEYILEIREKATSFVEI